MNWEIFTSLFNFITNCHLDLVNEISFGVEGYILRNQTSLLIILYSVSYKQPFLKVCRKLLYVMMQDPPEDVSYYNYDTAVD